MTRRFCIAFLALVALALGLACFSTKIGDIQANPRKYEGKEVTVSGTVERTLNLLVFKAFVLSDGTGEIRVVTDRILPSKGQKVTVTGTVEQGLALGEGSGIILRERATGGAKPTGS